MSVIIPTARSARRPRSVALAQTWILTIILLASVGFRFYRIGSASLWMDEFWSIEISTGRGSAHLDLPQNQILPHAPDLLSMQNAPSWPHLWPAMIGCTHPPLYHLLLRFWMDAFGTGAAATRSLSALASLAAIMVFFDVCRLLHGPSTALWAAAFMALATSQIDFAQEARSYSLLIFFALLSADALVRIKIYGHNWRTLSALTLALAATMLTHYFAAGAMLALFLWAILILRGSDRRRVILAFIFAAVLFIVIWGPWLGAQFRAIPTERSGWLFDAPDQHARNFLMNLSSLPARFLWGDDVAGRIAWPLAAFLGAALALAPLAAFRRRPEILFWLLWLAASVGLVAALDLTRGSAHLFYLRYTILASPALYALIATYAGSSPSPLRTASGLLLLITLLTATLWRLSWNNQSKEDWRTLAANVSPDPTTPLIYQGDGPWRPAGLWYIGVNYYLGNSPHPIVILNQPPTPDLLSQLNKYPSIQLIGPKPDAITQSWFPTWRTLSEQKTSAGEVCRIIRP